jgi:hypothetical protein
MAATVSQDGRRYAHYYNRLPDGTIIDLTRCQFSESAEYLNERPKTSRFRAGAIRRADLLAESLRNRTGARASDFTVALIKQIDAASFLERWHYSASASRGKYIGLFDRDGLAGVAAIKGLSGGNDKSRSRFNIEGLTVRELSRLALRDDCPKNSESIFLSKVYNVLRGQGVDLLLAYSDPDYGHVGTVYQASGWIYYGPSTGHAANDCYLIDGKPIASSGLRKMATTQRGREQALREMYGERLQVLPHSRKHVYLKTLTQKAREATERLLALREPLPYPKAHGIADAARGYEEVFVEKLAA